jgi:hypothetical protein
MNFIDTHNIPALKNFLNRSQGDFFGAYLSRCKDRPSWREARERTRSLTNEKVRFLTRDKHEAFNRKATQQAIMSRNNGLIILIERGVERTKKSTMATIMTVGLVWREEESDASWQDSSCT